MALVGYNCLLCDNVSQRLSGEAAGSAIKDPTLPGSGFGRVSSDGGQRKFIETPRAKHTVRSQSRHDVRRLGASLEASSSTVSCFDVTIDSISLCSVGRLQASSPRTSRHPWRAKPLQGTTVDSSGSAIQRPRWWTSSLEARFPIFSHLLGFLPLDIPKARCPSVPTSSTCVAIGVAVKLGGALASGKRSSQQPKPDDSTIFRLTPPLARDQPSGTQNRGNFRQLPG
jgi:hypothetical protein